MSYSRSTLRPGASSIAAACPCGTLAEQCRVVRSPSGDCAHQRSSLLVVSPRHWISIWRGMGALKGLALPMRPPARLPLWNRASLRVASIYRGITGMEDATPSRPGRAPSTCREGRRAPESLVAIRRPQSCPRSSSEPHMCAEREDDAEGEIVLDTARGCAYYSILRQARKRLSEPRGRPRRREP